jgi:hypothetical protein
MPREAELLEDIEGNGVHGVHIKLDTTHMPYKIATFDGRDKKVSEWKAALQRDEEIWYAEGYLEGKKNHD